MQLKHLLNLKVIMKFHPLKVSFILFLSVPVVVGRSEAVGVMGGVPQESSSLVFFFWTET